MKLGTEQIWKYVTPIWNIVSYRKRLVKFGELYHNTRKSYIQLNQLRTSYNISNLRKFEVIVFRELMTWSYM